MRVTEVKRNLHDNVSYPRKLSQRAKSEEYNIFTMNQFRKKIDYAVYCDYDIDIPKISDVETNIIRSNQPFRRRVSKSIFLSSLFMMPLSRIGSTRKMELW